MKKVELLAPAGSFEALQAAVQNGCDAVYLGGTMFGARAFANNFDDAQMLEAIHYAHGYGVKVYVTMNTLIMESEMDDAIAYAKFLYEANVDALIIQDLGFFDLCHQRFPDLELHASTQMHIHNPNGISLLKSLGAKRVVVPRETSIAEISDLAHMGVDLEVFVQGALCVSYSGQCLMSAKELQRSGNRGECAQMCRMRYRLGKLQDGNCTYIQTKGDYLLSPKDLNTLNLVPQLLAAGIASFKIEGRMKRPAYVALMVSLYRKAIDAYYAKESFYEQDGDHQMRMMFHREFTSGHLFHQKGSALMNPHRPNHMGVPIGSILKATRDRMTLRLLEDLHQGDGIRILQAKEDQGCMVNKLYKNGLLVNHAQKDDIVEIEFKGFVEKHAVVVKTSDKLQLEQLASTYMNGKRKVAIRMQAELLLGEKMRLKIIDEDNFEVVMMSEQVVERAHKTPLDQERLSQQLKKCGDTIFQVSNLDISMDDEVSIAIKEVNQLRRNALAQLTQIREERSYPKRYGTYSRSINISQQKQICAVVHSKAQYEIVKRYPNICVYGADICCENLQKEDEIGYYGPRVMKDDYPDGNVIFSENSGVLSHGIADHFVNITNSYAAALLFSLGCQGVTFSSECDESHIQMLVDAFRKRYGCEGNFLRYVYGHEELMISEYCPINMACKDNDKKACRLCKGKDNYVLEDIQGNHYPLWGDSDCRMHIMSQTPVNEIKPDISYGMILHFYKENAEATKAIIDSL